MDSFNNGNNLDSIPMPSTSLNLEQSNSNNNNIDGNASSTDAWKRAQNALSSIGGRPTTLQNKNQQSLPYFPAAFQGYPLSGYGNPPGFIHAGFPTNRMPLPYAAPRPNIHANANFNFPRINVMNPNAIASNNENSAQQKRPMPYTPFNPTKKVLSNFPHIKPVRFLISSNNTGTTSSSFAATSSHGTSDGGIPYPPAVKDYIERAYMATDEADRPKLEKYLKDRVEPLLKSGAVYTVNWANEPLPHESNFVVRTAWTPASELKKQYQQQNTTTKSTSSVSLQSKHRNRSSSSESDKPIFVGFKLASKNKFNAANDTMSNKLSKKMQKKQKKEQRKLTAEASAFSAAKADIPIKGGNSSWTVVNAPDRKDARKNRFAAERKRPMARTYQRSDYYVDVNRSYGGGAGEAFDISSVANVVGTCMEIEKQFFRLTAAPDPSQVRPLPVLLESLAMVKQTYKTEQNYRYACDQLKSIRQDLMIQNIRNEFTILVYESNARIALENKDREEFNQCQNQLKQLYAEVKCGNQWEFTGYRLLYYIYMKDILDVSSLLDGLLPEALQDECMSFALAIWDAWSMSNYVKFFRLYKKAPKMSGYLIDMFIDRERKAFCSAILKSFKPDIPLSVVADWMAQTESELIDWLAQSGISAERGGSLDCRQFANTTV